MKRGLGRPPIGGPGFDFKERPEGMSVVVCGDGGDVKPRLDEEPYEAGHKVVVKPDVEVQEGRDDWLYAFVVEDSCEHSLTIEAKDLWMPFDRQVVIEKGERFRVSRRAIWHA